MEKNILYTIFFDEYNHWDNLLQKYDKRIREVVDHFDFLDGGDPTDPPKFNCEECYGEMIPEYFESHTGIVYDNRTQK